jgi:ribose-phosphate pyrophosphokinase
MMKQLVFILPGNEQLGKSVIKGINAEEGNYILRNFPDGETYVRILSEVKNREVIIIASLHQPNSKFLPLFFLCKLLKERKAKSICLVAPYLAYMRQDKEFNPGEAVTSSYFAQLLSAVVDKLITIDPHLHRRKSMQEIYSIPCEVLHAAEPITQWIKDRIPNAVLIGPDKESEQWTADVAKKAGVPFLILDKTRYSDRNVKLKLPYFGNYKKHTPVLVDDIISTAHTMIEVVKELKRIHMKEPICIGVHGIFAENAFEELVAAGVADIITTNSIPHITGEIDISKLLIDYLKKRSRVPNVH